MLLKHYFPISVGVFVLVIAAAYRLSVPIMPFVLIVLCGETLIGFQLEEHKVSRVLRDLLGAFKSGLKPRLGGHD